MDFASSDTRHPHSYRFAHNFFSSYHSDLILIPNEVGCTDELTKILLSCLTDLKNVCFIPLLHSFCGKLRWPALCTARKISFGPYFCLRDDIRINCLLCIFVLLVQLTICLCTHHFSLCYLYKVEHHTSWVTKWLYRFRCAS